MPSRRRLRITRFQAVTPHKLELARKFRRDATPDERILWQALRHESLDGLHFRRQQVISGFIVDFYCAVVQVAIELDGPVHQGQSQDDAYRDSVLAAMGIRTIRIVSERVRNELPMVLEEIRAACNLTP